MELIAEKKLKQAIEKILLKKKKSLKIVYTIERLVLLITLFGGGGYFVYNLLSPTAHVGNVAGEVKKNYFIIFMLSSILIGMLLTAWLLIRVLRKKLVSLGLTERVDECMYLDEEFFTYTYRLRFQSLPTDRGVVVARYDEISKVVYNEDIRKLTIYGKMFEKWYQNFTKVKNYDASEREDRKFEIYDYFNPSLLQEFGKKVTIVKEYGN